MEKSKEQVVVEMEPHLSRQTAKQREDMKTVKW